MKNWSKMKVQTLMFVVCCGRLCMNMFACLLETELCVVTCIEGVKNLPSSELDETKRA